uniref:Uncharacterized protein n=1 Tax=Globisporangium ultimum (strain ATCC 200006 / CBS 805.95 / DAOM BR144) TaxID=431595 RepID=K3X5M4_GLOUD
MQSFWLKPTLDRNAMSFFPALKQTSSSSEIYKQTLQLFQLLQANVLDVSARIHSLLRLHIEQYTHYVDSSIDHDQPQLSSQLRRLKEDFFSLPRNLGFPHQE